MFDHFSWRNISNPSFAKLVFIGRCWPLSFNGNDCKSSQYALEWKMYMMIKFCYTFCHTRYNLCKRIICSILALSTFLTSNEFNFQTFSFSIFGTLWLLPTFKFHIITHIYLYIPYITIQLTNAVKT